MASAFVVILTVLTLSSIAFLHVRYASCAVALVFSAAAILASGSLRRRAPQDMEQLFFYGALAWAVSLPLASGWLFWICDPHVDICRRNLFSLLMGAMASFIVGWMTGCVVMIVTNLVAAVRAAPWQWVGCTTTVAACLTMFGLVPYVSVMIAVAFAGFVLIPSSARQDFLNGLLVVGANETRSLEERQRSGMAFLCGGGVVYVFTSWLMYSGMMGENSDGLSLITTNLITLFGGALSAYLLVQLTSSVWRMLGRVYQRFLDSCMPAGPSV
jgi:hypothetical protein